MTTLHQRLLGSLSGRVVALSLVFLALSLAWLVVVPIWTAPLEDPRMATEGAVRGALYDALQAEDVGAALEQSTLLREVAAANPRLRYHVWQATGEQVREASFGAASTRASAVYASELFAEAGAGPGYWRTTFEEPGANGDPPVRGRVTYEFSDGKKTYLEFGGIDQAVSSKLLAQAKPIVFWWASENVLAVAAGVLVIALLVLASAARSLRGLTKAAQSFQAGVGRVPLPEQGLPSEVAPLVHAVNDMVVRVEATYESQELFLATAAHELRTPLAILRTRLEELREAPTKVALRKDVQRLATLVNELLTLISIRSRRELPDTVDIVATTREAIADRVPHALGEGVEMELVNDVTMFQVDGDAKLVKVAVVNLLDNAVSFSAPGDVLSVRVTGGGCVQVRDRGPGVPRCQAEHIFEPFAKIPPNRRGHGLGLAIVKAIMGLHRGRVSVVNGAERGAVFTLHFGAVTG